MGLKHEQLVGSEGGRRDGIRFDYHAGRLDL